MNKGHFTPSPSRPLALSLGLFLFLPHAQAGPVEDLASAQGMFASAKKAADFALAAQAFEALSARSPNPGLEFNAGNAWFRAGDLGRTILHYRRSLRLDPGQAEAQANLSAARRKRLDQAEAEGPGILDRLAFWRNWMGLQAEIRLFFVLWVLGWALLGLRLFLPWQGGRALAAGFLAPALLLALSLGWEIREELVHPDAVIQAPEIYLRVGGGEGYDLAVKEPLHAGAELNVLERRSGWFRVALNKDISGWVPAEALALVPPG